MKTIIGKITIDILTSIYQPFWFAILLSIMTMFFYLYVKCPEGAGKGRKVYIVFLYYNGIIQDVDQPRYVDESIM